MFDRGGPGETRVRAPSHPAPDIEVAVCVSGQARWLLRCLERVGPQAPRLRVVVGGTGAAFRAEVERAIAAAAPRSESLWLSSPATSAVRNAALAACEADVLALLDDDVLVGPAWYEALRAAWSGASQETAVVGGSITPCLEGDRPAWLREDMFNAFGVVDYGSASLELELARETLHAGNASFRCDALRGAGGFWPARGHRWGRDWFSEEHNAQHELARYGWRGHFEPSLAAERMIARTDMRHVALLARRLRYGARMGRVGGLRRADVAARGALSACASLALAPLRSRPERLVGAHADRLVVNLGLLASPLVARSDSQLSGPTEFQPSIPPAARRFVRWPARRGRTGSRSPLILLYHSISGSDDGRGLTVSPTHFGEQLEVLRTLASPISMPEMITGWALEKLPHRSVSVTFDDGYANNVQAAVPALTRAGVPATIYVTTGPIASQTPFWWDEIADLLSGSIELPAVLALVIRGRAYRWRMTSAEERGAVRARLQRLVQPLQRDEIDGVLGQLRSWAMRAASSGLPEPSRPMTVQELCGIADEGCVAIGAHTRWHVSLAFQPREVQVAEIAAAREDLDGWLGRRTDGFAYPFGIIGSDVSPTTRELVERAGYEHGVAVAHGTAPSASHGDPYAMPRVLVPDLGAAAFEEWLAGQLGD
ncbi:MAG TPA: polysaccharide deacetylase family protein [Solirubrobacteraceae bacterium]|nr:polysaccharide deacetylase family protein [Solirubrobacteraceae bacterium]